MKEKITAVLLAVVMLCSSPVNVLHSYAVEETEMETEVQSMEEPKAWAEADVEEMPPVQAEDTDVTDLSGEFTEEETAAEEASEEIILGETEELAEEAELESLSVTADVPLDRAHFPDDVFREYLSLNFDTDKNGILSAAECSAVYTINLSISIMEATRKTVKDLKGVEYFPNLINLFFTNNDVSSLDLSGNPRLGSLYCASNELAALDLSGKTNLLYLECSRNSLTVLKTNQCTSLELLGCTGNKLQNLDVTTCPMLRELRCDENKIAALNLSNCTQLRKLMCQENKIGSLDLSACGLLQELQCSGNKLEFLDTAKCSGMETVNCSRNELREITLGAAVKNLGCGSNKLTQLDVSSCIQLEELSCGYNQIQCLELGSCPLLRALYCYNNDMRILEVSGNTALEVLMCNENQLTALDVGEASLLEYLNCSECQLQALNVQNCTALKSLFCDSNLLENVDISRCSSLRELKCQRNRLESLDISGCTQLENADCSQNQMTELTVEACPWLKELDCSNNQLDQVLNLSQCPSLKLVNCSRNKLTGVDVSACPSLETLHCTQNELAEIDVSACTSLKVLYCSQNELAEIDVSACASLETLACSENSLTSLNFENCIFLRQLLCQNNALTVLDITGLPLLNHLDCSRNKLTELLLGEQHFSHYSYYDFAFHGNALYYVDQAGCTSDQPPYAWQMQQELEVTAACVEGTWRIPFGNHFQENRIENVKLLTEGVEIDGADLVFVNNNVPETIAYIYSQGEDCWEIPVTLKVTKVGEEPKHLHSWSIYEEKKRATIFEEGLMEASCPECGEKRQMHTPKLTGGLTLNYEELTLQTGQFTDVLQVSGLEENDKVESWSSDAPAIAGVDENGRILAGKKEGTALITVRLQSGRSETVTVDVQREKVCTEELDGLPEQVTVKVGKDLALTPERLPATSQEKVTYKSSNPKVAAVTADGVIMAGKAGKAKITVKSGTQAHTVSVTVRGKKSKARIRMNQKQVTLYLQGTRQKKLTAAVTGTSKKVRWKSRNKKVAVVNSKGRVTAKRTGTTVITASIGKVRASCRVTVRKRDTKTDVQPQFVPQAESIRTEEQEVLFAYKEFLEMDTAACGQEYCRLTAFRVLDMDGDGIPELLVKAQGAETVYGLYEYAEEVSLVAWLDHIDELLYYPNAEVLETGFVNRANRFGSAWYAVREESLSEVSFYSSGYDSGREQDIYCYSVDGEQVTKPEFDRHQKELLGEEKPEQITFVTNTPDYRSIYLG